MTKEKLVSSDMSAVNGVGVTSSFPSFAQKYRFAGNVVTQIAFKDKSDWFSTKMENERDYLTCHVTLSKFKIWELGK